MNLPIAAPLRLILREIWDSGIAPESREGERWIRRRLEDRSGKLCPCGAELRVWEVLAGRDSAPCTCTERHLLLFRQHVVALAALAAYKRKAC